MENLLTVIFKAEDIQTLLDQSPDKIVVRSIVEEGRLEDGEKAGVIKVFADAVKNDEVLETISGCPKPPCM